MKEEEFEIRPASVPNKGGQHVGSVNSGVILEHIPTQIQIRSMGERSQMKNRQKCFEVFEWGTKGPELKDLCNRLLYFLDIVEVSDSEREFKPNRISSCRAYDGQEMNKILNQIKQITKDENQNTIS
jgi:hypothetical protein